MCYRSRFCPQVLLMTSDREVKGQTLGITKGYNLMNDPYLHIMLHRMKAQTPLVSHQRDNVTKDPSCRTQCM
ncbi:hypothetical protein AAG906_029230 [Vitis piasezkii]